ncbi:MAG TPA: glycerol-3-phosphate dehydrogenase, partial [Cyanothece sp. UBA12306]|nr:glycerol-3-phosphate dehydrogenase [Cyanothece sp. UBA12306]
MLPRLIPQNNIHHTIANFLETLKNTSFSGEVRGDLASRLMGSTDNSIYQILPQAVVFPQTTEDVQEIFQLAQQTPFDSLTFSPRGGGTGTNGQSLSPGIIIDCSKYMNHVLEVDLDQQWVRVQPGVILDQLNQYLQGNNLFFAPSLAPSNRATIGGMINTDAAGKGSRIYGRTSDHILELTWVLSDGTIGTSSGIDQISLNQFKQQVGRRGKIYQQIDEIVTSKQKLINEVFPKMTRFMTGYNLGKVYDTERNFFDINRIISGSEGTLAVITEAKLKLTKIPKFTQLLVLHYSDFNDALNDAGFLLQFEPAAIETIDDKILGLAKEDALYFEIKDFIGKAKSLNLVEFIAENKVAMEQKIEAVIKCLERHKNQAIGYYLADNKNEIKQLWNLRKRGVELLTNLPGDRQPIAFIEDTAVPPANLANYTQDLQKLFSKYKLNYAMFGHVDVGCLHVRPALDLKSPNDEKLIRELSDQVVTLVRQYGGVMWGEHGKGFRSEYTSLFFGEELYQDLRKIKAAFDPNNKLNPGKIVTAYGSSLKIVPLESPLRGQFDRQVSVNLRSQYQKAFRCNGNSACFNFNPDEIICPSAKATRDHIHSPKGRAMLLRE